MKILSAAILIAFVPLSTASAQLGKDASYFCTAEFAGGIRYDERTKKWMGAAFRADKKFVLRLKHLRTRVEKDFARDDTVYDYNVTVTKAGLNDPLNCLPGGYSSVSEEHVTVFDYDSVFTCATPVHEYKFNLKNNRFLEAYLWGYVDGDKNDDTPSITGGTCAPR